MAESSPLSGVNVVLVMAYGSLVSSVTTSLDACLVIGWLSRWEPATLLKTSFLSGVCAVVHFREKANHAFCNEIPPRTPRTDWSQRNQGTADYYKRARVGGQRGDTYWMCLSRVWKRTLIPGFPGSRKSASNLVSCQRKTIVWSRDPKLVSHLIITITCPSSVPKLLNCLSISKVATTTCTGWRLWTRSGTRVSPLFIGLTCF